MYICSYEEMISNESMIEVFQFKASLHGAFKGN